MSNAGEHPTDWDKKKKALEDAEQIFRNQRKGKLAPFKEVDKERIIGIWNDLDK